MSQAHDLQARDFSGTADPYAKIRLLPDRSNIWQTKIHKKTLNPVFDEDFVFEVPPATFERHCLEILLYDFDAYSRHHCIGGLNLPFSEIDLSERVDFWKPLNPICEPDSRVDLGELMVSFSYLPASEQLNLIVFKARNLRVVDSTRKTSGNNFLAARNVRTFMSLFTNKQWLKLSKKHLIETDTINFFKLIKDTEIQSCVMFLPHY